MEKNRNIYLDIVKAVTIILVVFGHCIQYGSGSEYLSGAFFGNPIFIFIYSFHMPLFMLVSGYLFAYSAKQIDEENGWIRLIRKKATQLLVPLLCLGLASLGFALCKLIIKGNTDEINLIWFVKRFISGFINGPWFLWAIWWCSLLIIVARRFLKDSPIVYILVLLVTFVIPDYYGLSLYKFMYPFYVLAYFFNTYELEKKLKIFYMNKIVIGITIVIFAVLLALYNIDTYIYTSGYSLLGKNVLSQVYNDCLRFAVGLFGSVSILYVLCPLSKMLKGKLLDAMTYIGQNTLGIYLISGYLNRGLARLVSSMDGINYIYTIMEAICIMLLSLGINALLKRWKITNILFLGGR